MVNQRTCSSFIIRVFVVRDAGRDETCAYTGTDTGCTAS